LQFFIKRLINIRGSKQVIERKNKQMNQGTKKSAKEKKE